MRTSPFSTRAKCLAGQARASALPNFIRHGRRLVKVKEVHSYCIAT